LSLYILQVRPRGVGPPWWPRYDQIPEVHERFEDDPAFYVVAARWATVHPDIEEDDEDGEDFVDYGGYTMGIDPTQRLAYGHIGPLMEAWHEHWTPDDDENAPVWPWEFRVLKVLD